ncbi:DoxX family membrane protein [Kineosporiaceae bacterium SCSIO 59966]|nr:DoxX family membrane protein [Kineosporiaceae bacterium SCSIO 59966]
MNRASVVPWVGTVLRLVLAGVLGYAGAIKLPDPDESVRAVRAYQLLPEPVVQVVGFGLPVLEVAVALLLLLGLGTRIAAGMSGLLMIAFIIGVASAWARGLTIDCGCFGGGGEVSAEDTEYPQEILRDLLLLAASAWLVWRPRTRLALDNVLFPDRHILDADDLDSDDPDSDDPDSDDPDSDDPDSDDPSTADPDAAEPRGASR